MKTVMLNTWEGNRGSCYSWHPTKQWPALL